MQLKDTNMTYIDNTTETWAKDALTTAQRAFTKNPNSLNWNLCLKAMFTHQQVQFAARSNTVDHEKLSFDLDNNPIGEWQNIICRATVGYPVREALKEYGTAGC
jgi:hypothetical protein